MATTAQPSRLSRLLALVPYFLARQGISIDQAARDLGVTPRQLTKDLEQLFVCGLPGYYPSDLIDIEFSEGVVDVRFTAGINRPLRLTTTEASTLLVALRALVDARGTVDRDAARRAIAKIERAVGSTVPSVTGPDGDGDSVEESPIVGAIREAVRSRRALSIRYYSATRDSVSERVVDPIRLQVVDHNTYLEAWCRSSDGVRLFRFDRVDAATVLDEPATPPGDAVASSQSAILSEDAGLPTAEIEIDASELWVLDYYLIDPLEPVGDRSDPSLPLRGRLVYGSPEWLARFLLGFGGRIRLVGEPEIVGAVTDTAAAARARYR
ncbi:helix-turn-helix transcriptional regulator [Gordonia soli]|uniref:Proteasome accessory factor C n=1 Tax=Gordonia soli NBRC 108243 TaxID=1223545 RepID=M0QPF7_9ACTN|nr:WYL domain-containing protein [Gordonia soli]GAC70284.1 proteasome accessory factor C [Gordonia soli NBRC 108243]